MSSAVSIRNDLRQLFAAEGYPLTIRRNVGGPYDPMQGIKPASTDDIEWTGVGRVGTYSDYVIDGKQILRGDRKATFVPNDDAADDDDNTVVDPFFDNLAYASQPGDVLVVTKRKTYIANSGDEPTVIEAGEEYTIITAQKRELGGEIISWTMQIRR